ncbi:hypothetical protein I4U23_011113 [Adineta vaga]|nr:hypothetical protein I4U23_011113 [Adineta vaga]
MESIVERVKIEIDRTMKDLSDTGKAKLEDVRSSFEQFFQLLNSPKDIRIELFCQQLDRLLNNNNSFSIRFWIELYQDILHILGKNDNPQKTAFGGSFRKRMEFEKELQQRKISAEKLQKQKKLKDFVNEHEQFFKVYFENCISFHSKLQVENLFEDMAKFSEDFVNVENWINLQEKLKCINIEYDCTDRILYKFSCDRLRDNYSSENVIADITNYLPSKDQSNIDGQKSHVVLADLLEQHRWIVILADPGNSKTTLLRWLTYRFAEAAENGCNRVNFKVDQQRSVTIRVRIPILIRIGEFATWLEQDRTKTLIDYIGEHTWFSKRYCFDEKNGQILRELISQGHALILLDGLDEVANGQQIPDIVRCVKNFIKDYVQSSDFISAFDEKFIGNIRLFNEVIETKLPKKSAGNQIS